MIRRNLSYANVVATLALVFAMSGGAYAASRYLITSTRQIKPGVLGQLKGKAGPAGANGAAGAQGPVGPVGPQGPAGGRGETGASGANGVSVTSATVAKGNASCKEGGTEFKSASEKPAFACNGEKGSPGTAGGALPAGKTLTGVWSVGGYAPEQGFVLGTSVSYALPLENAPAVHYIRREHPIPQGCTGDADDPGAEKGNLCVFVTGEENSLQEVELAPGTSYYFPTICTATRECQGAAHPNSESEGSLFGFSVLARAAATGVLEAYGTWAVTAG